jgi:hypothetical protein
MNRDAIKELVRQALSESLPSQSAATPVAPVGYRAPWTGVSYEPHPSQQQFNVNEASELKQQLLEMVEQQLCTIEKNRACDHCGVCKSLGF